MVSIAKHSIGSNGSLLTHCGCGCFTAQSVVENNHMVWFEVNSSPTGLSVDSLNGLVCGVVIFLARHGGHRGNPLPLLLLSLSCGCSCEGVFGSSVGRPFFFPSLPSQPLSSLPPSLAPSLHSCLHRPGSAYECSLLLSDSEEPPAQYWGLMLHTCSYAIILVCVRACLRACVLVEAGWPRPGAIRPVPGISEGG